MPGELRQSCCFAPHWFRLVSFVTVGKGFLTPGPQLNQAHVGHRWGHTLPEPHLVLPSPGAQVPSTPFVSVISRLLTPLSLRRSLCLSFLYTTASGLVEEEVAAPPPHTSCRLLLLLSFSPESSQTLYTVESN